MRSRISKSFFRVLAIVSASIFAVSCMRESVIDPIDGGNGGESSSEATFVIDIPGSATPKTRGIEEGSEADNVVFDLILMLFDPETGMYIEAVAAETINETDVINHKKATIPDMPDGAYRAIVIANVLSCLIIQGDEITQDGLIDMLDSMYSSITIEEVVASEGIDFNGFSYAYDGQDPKDFVSFFNMFLMGGYYNIPANRSERGTIYLQRSVAKINVNGTAVKDIFTISEIEVRNINQSGTIFPAMVNGDEISMFDPDHINPYGNYNNNYHTEIYGSDKLNTHNPEGVFNSCIDEIFVPETIVLEGINEENLGANDNWKDAVALLIKGNIDGVGERWFRVNLRMPDAANGGALRHVNLVRNHRFTINITGVNGIGYATAYEAYNALPADLEVNLTAIDERDMNDIVYNGQYYLAVNKTEFNYPAWGGELDLKVFTDYPGGWKVTQLTGGGSWLPGITTSTAGTAGGAASTPVPSEVQPNPINSGRTATFVIEAGQLRHTITVTQDPTIYVFAAPGVVGIKASEMLKPFGERSLTLRGSSTYKADYINSYLPEGQKGDYDYIEFIADEFGGLEDEPVYTVLFKWGSMVAMIGSESDTWSADDVVWVNDEYDLETYPITNVINDGDGGGGDTLYPYTGYGGFSAADHSGINSSHNIIGDSPKGEGDICMKLSENGEYPHGSYRTPHGVSGWYGMTTADWTRVTAVNNGVGNLSLANYDQTIFLPSTGVRGPSDGVVYNLGGHGSYWSSTANGDVSAYGLSFNNYIFEPSRGGSYAHALAIRCVLLMLQ